MSREVIIKSNDNILNEARKTKFMLDYHNWIESKVNAIDNHLHVRTTNSRHKKRVTDKVVEELLEDMPEVGYVTKKQQQRFQAGIIPFTVSLGTSVWKHHLEIYDLRDLELGCLKEERLLAELTKPKESRQKEKSEKQSKPKMKSVVVVPTVTHDSPPVPPRKRIFSSSAFKTKNRPNPSKRIPSSTPHTTTMLPEPKPFVPIVSCMESLPAKYKVPYEAPQVLPPIWTESQRTGNGGQKGGFDWSRVEFPNELVENIEEFELDLGVFEDPTDWA